MTAQQRNAATAAKTTPESLLYEKEQRLTGISSVSSDTELEKKPLLQRLNYLNLAILTVPPLVSIIGLCTVPLRLPTFILAVAMYFATGMGITAGYHRLWAHRAYKATFPVQFFLAVFGAAAFEGSARWWCRNHRAHHRYVDTSKDPYNATKGFWYSHLGWMLVKQNPNNIGRVDISDLSGKQNKLLQWQHNHYLSIALTTCFLLPTLVASLWGDALGGFLFAGFLRVVFVHHATFFVNSLAHSVGSQPFTDEHTACDSFITAILTLGEGYHNFHHTYPNDYRNAVRFYQYDPTKWLIRGLSFLGLTYSLNRFDGNMIKKSVLQQKQAKIERQLEQLDRKISAAAALKYKKAGKKAGATSGYDMTLEQMMQKVTEEGEQLVAINGKVIDVRDWTEKHPGGKEIIQRFLGRDATDAFNGLLYKHSRSANNILKTLTVGTVLPSSSSSSSSSSSTSSTSPAAPASGLGAQIAC